MNQYVTLVNKIIDLFGMFFSPDAVLTRNRKKLIYYSDRIIRTWEALVAEKNAKRRIYLRKRLEGFIRGYRNVRRKIA